MSHGYPDPHPANMPDSHAPHSYIFPERCGVKTRGGRGATCQLRKHHSGTHSAVVYHCDGCGQTFRGRVGFMTGKDAPDSSPNALNFCLPCAKGYR